MVQKSFILATSITQICNLSIKLSTVPDECKIAKLKSFYKKGKKTDPKKLQTNFFTSSYFQNPLLEKVIHDQTMEFITKKKILYKFQSGFQKFQKDRQILASLSTR